MLHPACRDAWVAAIEAAGTAVSSKVR
jgi:hypothetical protein